MKNKYILTFTSFAFAAIATILWINLIKHGNAQKIRSSDTAISVTHGGNPKNGYQVIITYGCGACHKIPGVPGAAGVVGPALSKFGQQATVAGVMANTSENLIKWIQHPREVDPKTAMPELGLTQEEARDVAAYLYSPR